MRAAHGPPILFPAIASPKVRGLKTLPYVMHLQIFPGASHNRFEHSLGVGYLASEHTIVEQRQPEPQQKVVQDCRLEVLAAVIASHQQNSKADRTARSLIATPVTMLDSVAATEKYPVRLGCHECLSHAATLSTVCSSLATSAQLI